MKSKIKSNENNDLKYRVGLYPEKKEKKKEEKITKSIDLYEKSPELEYFTE